MICSGAHSLPSMVTAPSSIRSQYIPVGQWNRSFSDTYGTLRFPITLLWIFSSLAPVLSAVGISSVMSYIVTRRTRELAILSLNRLMSGYVYGISPSVPLTLAGASLLLMGVALLASYVPTRREQRSIRLWRCALSEAGGSLLRHMFI
jgi:hypothetical protein